MKKLLFILTFISYISISNTTAQINLNDILGAVKEGFGKSVETAEKNADNDAMQKKFKAEFSDKFKKWGEFTNNLDYYSSQTKCLYMMAKYISEFEELKKQTKKTSDCKRKYDLYGMQQMMLMSSTSIMFCTEELYNKTNLFAMMLAHDNGGGNVTLPKDISYEDDVQPYFQPIKEDLLEIHKNTENRNQERKITDFEKTIYTFYGTYHILGYENNNSYVNILAIHKLLETYFHPLTLAKEAISISKEMDVLKPCANQ